MAKMTPILKQVVKFVISLAVVPTLFVGIMMIALQTDEAQRQSIEQHGKEIFYGLWTAAAWVYAAAFVLYPVLLNKWLKPQSKAVSAGFFLAFYVILYFVVAFLYKAIA